MTVKRKRVICRNNFAILSEEDNEIVKETQKDYNSDPGTIPQREMETQNSEDVLVRKSRRAKAQPKKLNL